MTRRSIHKDKSVKPKPAATGFAEAQNPFVPRGNATVEKGNAMPDGSNNARLLARESITADPMDSLAAAYYAAEKALNDYGNLEEAAHDKACAEYPPAPAEVLRFFQSNDLREGGARLKHVAPYQEGMILQHYKSCPSGSRFQDVAIEALASWRRWRDACDAIDRKHKLDEVEKKSDELANIVLEAEERLIAEPTTSAIGILRKLERVVALEDLEEQLRESPRLLWPRAILSIVRDLKKELVRD